MPAKKRTVDHTYTDEEEREDDFVDDESEDCEDEEEEDWEDEEDEDDSLLEKLEFEAEILNNTFDAYHTAFKTKTAVKELLPTRLELWELVEITALQFANGLQDILQSPTPPTLEDLTSLEEYKATSPPTFIVYMLILQHAGAGSGSRPLIYVGTGTDQKKGVEARFKDYDRQKNFSTHTQEAYDQGYKITHKMILVSGKIPDTHELVHAARGLFKMLETSLSYMLHAYKEPKITHPMFSRFGWLDHLAYGGCVRHDAWTEGVARSKWLFSGLSNEEIAEIQRQRRNERRAERIAEETPEEKKQRQYDDNKWRRDRDVNETADERQKRRAKAAAWARDQLANETPDHRAARLATKKRYRDKETPDQRKARLAHHKAYIKKRLEKETPDERAARLKKKREDSKRYRDNLTPAQRAARNAQSSQCQKKKKAAETKEEREDRLERGRQYRANKRAKETPEQRDKRLAAKRESNRRAAAKKRKME